MTDLLCETCRRPFARRVRIEHAENLVTTHYFPCHCVYVECDESAVVEAYELAEITEERIQQCPLNRLSEN